jgi:hypothetical protein
MTKYCCNFLILTTFVIVLVTSQYSRTSLPSEWAESGGVCVTSQLSENIKYVGRSAASHISHENSTSAVILVQYNVKAFFYKLIYFWVVFVEPII